MKALNPELNALIDRGLLTCRELAEVTAFAREINAAVARGEMTLPQADALGQLLGVQCAASRAANTNARRAERSLR